MAERSQYLDEVGVEPSHEDSLDQFFLFTVLVAYGRGHGTVRWGRHQEGFVEVLRELLDKAYREETAPGRERVTFSFTPLDEITTAGQHHLWPWRSVLPVASLAPRATTPVLMSATARTCARSSSHLPSLSCFCTTFFTSASALSEDRGEKASGTHH